MQEDWRVNIFVKKANVVVPGAAASEPAAVHVPGDAGAPATPKWNWHGFKEGLRDEGVPMAGMVLGAYLGHKLAPEGLDASRMALGGSGIGYGLTSIANVAADPAIEKLKEIYHHFRPPSAVGTVGAVPGAGAAMKSAAGDVGAYIPAAIGATLGAGVGGGLSQDERTKGRNMLAGAGAGYAVGEMGMLGHYLIDAMRRGGEKVDKIPGAKLVRRVLGALPAHPPGVH
jgi:hypothetical protein